MNSEKVWDILHFLACEYNCTLEEVNATVIDYVVKVDCILTNDWRVNKGKNRI